MNREPISLLVTQEKIGLARPSVLETFFHRACRQALHPSVLPAMDQQMVPTGMTHDFRGAVSGDVLRHRVPENDPTVPVDDVDSRVQAVECRAVEFAFVQGLHGPGLHSVYRRSSCELDCVCPPKLTANKEGR